MSDPIDETSEERETALSRIVVPERQRVEEALVQSKLEIERKLASQTHDVHLLRAAIDSCSDGILILDTQGAVRDYNRSLLSLLLVPDATLQEDALAAFSQLFEDVRQVRARFDSISTSSLLESHDVMKDKHGRIVAFSSFIQIAEGAVIGRVWNVRLLPEEVHGSSRNFA